jgi:hypothetical protein
LRSSESGWPIPPAAPRTVTLEDCSSQCQRTASQWQQQWQWQLSSSKKPASKQPRSCAAGVGANVGIKVEAEAAYLAGRRREGAALGLGESVPGSEHDGCDGGINEDGLTGQCGWVLTEMERFAMRASRQAVNASSSTSVVRSPAQWQRPTSSFRPLLVVSPLLSPPTVDGSCQQRELPFARCGFPFTLTLANPLPLVLITFIYMH